MKSKEDMRLTPLLSRLIIKEVSQKLIGKLLKKFKEQSKDDEKTMVSIINAFDRYKESLPVDKRDITTYNYDDLKSLVVGRELEKSAEKAVTQLRKKWDKFKESLPADQSGPYRYEPNVLKTLVAKFYDILPYLGENQRDIMKYDYFTLAELINKNYSKILNKVIGEKLAKDRNVNPDTLLFYIQSYIQNRARVPRGTKPIFMMTFTELEHLVDGTLAQQDDTAEKYKEDFSDIDTVYNDNNLEVFAPKSKDQCVKLKNGRTWCTSREGSGNMYYNYRLGHERTLYYVIDHDKTFSDLNYAVVLLVDPDGGISLADGSNSGRYSGHSNIPWSEIETKIPKLKGLKDLFVPKPLTKEERELINKVRNARVGDDPIASLGDEKTAEMWLEYNSPRLDDKQFSNLTPNLQKKYIGLGFDLSGTQLRNASETVISYYVNKKKEKLANTPFDRLSSEDLELLALPMMKRLKDSLKPKFAESLTSEKSGAKSIEIEFPRSAAAKFIALYGFEDFFQNLPTDITRMDISGPKSENIAYALPTSIGRLTNISGIHIDGILSELPDEICQLKNLRYLSLPNNTQLKTLPICLGDLPHLKLVNTRGCTNLQVPEELSKKIKVWG